MATIPRQKENSSHHVIIISITHYDHNKNDYYPKPKESSYQQHIINTSTCHQKFAIQNLESKAHNKNDYYPKPKSHITHHVINISK